MKKRTYMDQPIKKETIALGVAGQIKRDDGFPELPPRARLTIRVEADYDTIKHKFLEKGGIEETLILTIDPSTFEVLNVREAPVQEELPVDADDKAKIDAAISHATSNEKESVHA